MLRVPLILFIIRKLTFVGFLFFYCTISVIIKSIKLSVLIYKKGLIILMNRVVLVGRLTKDPDLRHTPAGVPVCTFTLAVNRPFSNQQGERETDFINCVVWRKPGENAAKFLKKGSMAGVDGKIQTRNYEGQDGKRVYVTEVLGESVQFLESKNARNNDYQPPMDPPPEREKNNSGYTRINEDPFAEGSPIDITDDALPF